MNSIGADCTELKKQYDACFNTWFSEHFLKGSTDDKMCAPLLKVYQECVQRAMKTHNIDLKEVEKDLLGTEQERKPPNKNHS
ncbi:TP53-regulated inhibitor of apoptosis 1-like [Atheta coriaria]|uniref:TP53-regulated inhibitor of apoptosis 1-like n=1 Tax=Dalotia coriaria TaxID=877792 RepID=UPI0031F3B28A